MDYPNFRKVVEELQAVPHEKRVFDFLFTEPLGEKRKYQLVLVLDNAMLIPIVEAIGMRLKWCLKKTIDHKPNELFNGDAALDAQSLLQVLSKLMQAAAQVSLPVDWANYGKLFDALHETNKLVAQVIEMWE